MGEKSNFFRGVKLGFFKKLKIYHLNILETVAFRWFYEQKLYIAMYGIADTQAMPYMEGYIATGYIYNSLIRIG